MKNVESLYLTVADLAARWHQHPETIRRKLRDRVLECVVIGRQKLIPLDKIEQFERGATLEAQQAIR